MNVASKSCSFAGTKFATSVVSSSDMTNTKLAPEKDEKVDLKTFAKEHYLVTAEEDLHRDVYPQLDSISPRFFYRFLPIPDEPRLEPEYVYVKRPTEYGLTGEARSHYEVFISMWNNTWEAGRERAAFLTRDVPEQLRWVMEKDADIRLVKRAATHNYDPFAPLYHLLPRRTIERFSLPILRRCIWPHHMDSHLLEHVLPPDFDAQLEQAFTYHLWPLLGSRGAPSRFSSDDPVRMLSHNLDYWMPYIDMVAQERARTFTRTEFEDKEQESDYYAHKGEMPPGVSLRTPLKGGSIWFGEDDALEATHEMIEFADAHGDLRAILDAVRSHRIEDDFSERWSFEREDFERKLYSKRSKVKVAFVELDDTIPVHGPQSEIHEDLLWEDFFTLLDAKERRIVVCLRKGETKLADIARTLGYANHSPISKRLAQIRKKAKTFFEIE
jgi:hypothetical protein